MEFLIILILVILNGIFAMAEIALVSSRKARLEEKANKGSKGAKTALLLLKKPEEFLSTVQVGITFIGIIAGAYGGVAWAEDISPFFEQYTAFKEYAVEISYVIVIGLITYLSLIIGELVPKSIAYNNPEGISIALAPVMRMLSLSATPVIRFLTFSTRIVLRIFGITPKNQPPVTEEEIKILIEQGSRFGSIEKNETEMIKSIFRFGDRKAHSIMINRQDIVWIDVNDSLEDTKETVYNSNYSRLPLGDGSLDQIIGIIKVKDFFRHFEKGNELNLKDLAVQPLFIPENLPAIKILERFRETKIHIAVVINEYGSIEGMITLHDLIENIFGELPGKHEIFETPIFEREDGSLLIEGSLLIDELKEKVKIQFEHSEEYSTLGGYMMFKLNKIPQIGDSFISGNYKFEVIDMDGKRVDKVLVGKEDKKIPA
ncbi:MAG: HlyC/CorC family transporter [Deltaproteobacteria bacterium]|nr:MAG: HlyC/CorC family transporter [Deltaproteobacteria bacterium]